MRIRLTLLIVIILIFTSSQCGAETGKGANIVFIGDSVTEGSIGIGYITKLPGLGLPWNETNLINSGANGQFLRHYYENTILVTNRITLHDPEYLFINLGLADIRFLDPALYELHYTWLIETVLEWNKTNNGHLRQIFLMKFTWAGLFPEEYIAVPGYFDVIENVTVKYELGSITNLWNVTEGHSEYFVDGVHPSHEGAEIIASQIHNSTSEEITFTRPAALSDTSEAPFDSLFGNFLMLPLIVTRLRKKFSNLKKNK